MSTTPESEPNSAGSAWSPSAGDPAAFLPPPPRNSFASPPPPAPTFDPAAGRTRRAIYRSICALPMVLPVLLNLANLLPNWRFLRWDSSTVNALSSMVIAIFASVFAVMPSLRFRVNALGIFFLYALLQLPTMIVQLCTGWVGYVVTYGGFGWMGFSISVMCVADLVTPFLAVRLMRWEIEREWKRLETAPRPDATIIFPVPWAEPPSWRRKISWWLVFLLPLIAPLFSTMVSLVLGLTHFGQMRWSAFFIQLITLISIGGLMYGAIRGRRPHWRLLLYGALRLGAYNFFTTWMAVLPFVDYGITTGTFFWTGISDPHWAISTVWLVVIAVGMVGSVGMVRQRSRVDLGRLQLGLREPEHEEEMAAPGWDEVGPRS